METKRRGALALCFGALLLGAAFANPIPQGAMRVVPVAGTVSTLISGRGGNIGISAGDDGVLMVDSLFEKDVEDVRAAMASVAKGDPLFLINTHVHGDHTGGNDRFAKSATIFAHANVRGRLKSEGRAAASMPVLTYEDRVTVHFNGEDIALFHVGPAHTDGDTIVWFQQSNVVHMGDLFFHGKYPYIDLGRGGDVEGYLAGLRKVLATVPEDAHVIPGHGEVTDMAGLARNLEVLEDIVGRFQEAIDEGLSAEEILGLDLTADYDPEWGTGFIDPKRLARTLVESLTR